MGTLQRVVNRLRDDDTHPDYACLACDSAYDVRYHVCPECGGYSVERPDR